MRSDNGKNYLKMNQTSGKKIYHTIAHLFPIKIELCVLSKSHKNNNMELYSEKCRKGTHPCSKQATVKSALL